MASEDGLSQIVQENLLILLCFDDKHAKIIRGVIEYDLFEGIYRDIAKEVYHYIDREQEAPKAHLPDLFDEVLAKEDRKAKQYGSILKSLHQNKDEVNVDFVMRRMAQFVRAQRVKGAMMEAIEIFQAGRIDDDALDRIENVIAEGMRKRLEVFDPGITLADPRSLEYLDPNNEETFRTGIKELDVRNLGPLRKGIHLFIGLPKKGKTWWLVNIGKNALLEGRKVCHVTLEMSQMKMSRRYHQALFAMARRRPKESSELFKKTKLIRDELGRLSGFKVEDLEPKIALTDEGVDKELEMKLEVHKRQLSRIRVKNFPTGQLTVPQLVAFLDGLEIQQGWIPDLLIVDYPGIMKFDYRYQRMAIGDIVKSLRGLAAERNMAVAIVAQSNRKGAGSSKVSDSNIGEDWSQIATCDVILTYSQTEFERKLGLARVTVVDARDEEDQFTVLVSQSYATGQFCRDSVRISDDHYFDLLKQHGRADNDVEAEDEDEDE